MIYSPGRWGAVAIILATRLMAQSLAPVERTLPNGFRLIMVERHDQPVIECGWVVKVGSVFEKPGSTGIAHVLEHMMKKGTKVIGTRNFQKDVELNAQQDKLWTDIRKEEDRLRIKQQQGEIVDMYDPKVRSEHHQELLKEYDKLVKALSEITVTEEYDKLYRTEGAVGRNAFTSHDVTGHIITIPSNKLEYYAWMESDRLLNAQFRNFYSERDVIRDERRGNVESSPTGKAMESYNAMVWDAHPYRWPIIGWASDIQSITREQVQDFFKTFYVPNNISFVLVGDINPEETFKLFEKYFSRIPANTKAIPQVVTLEPKAEGEKRILVEAETTPKVVVTYKTVAVAHKDDTAINLLTTVLDGASGRLNKALVLEQKLATHVSVSANSRRFGGLVHFSGTAAPGHTPEDVEKAIYVEIGKIQKDGITDKELRKGKNQIQAHVFRLLQNNDGLRRQLMMAESTNTLQYFLDTPKLVEAITKEDVQRVAQDYLTKENRNVGIILRKKGKGHEGPDSAALPHHQSMAKREVQ